MSRPGEGSGQPDGAPPTSDAVARDASAADAARVGPRASIPAIRVASGVDRAAWDAFIAARPEADPLQAWAWGDAMARVGERPLRLLAQRPDGTLCVAAQLVLRSAGFGRSVAYVPHGPVWDREAGDGPALLAAAASALRRHGRAARAIVVKIDPRASADGTSPDEAALTRLGLLRARHDLQAPTTRTVQLHGTDEELMRSWDRDARNLVRRSAREGVTVDVDRDGDPHAIAAFHAMWEATAGRGRFRIRSQEFLRTLAAGLAPSGGWFLVLARLGERPIAGAVATRVGDRGFYFYGASLRDAELRNAHGAYAALAGAMRALAADGVTSFDLWGVVERGDSAADAAWTGFSDFKRQFGGTPVRHPGTFDLVVDRPWYVIRAARERLRERLARRG